MSQAPTASDLFQIALAALQPRAAPVEPRPTGGFSWCAVVELSALACIAAALGCALVAVGIYAAPMLGAAGALLVVSSLLCAVGFAAFVVQGIEFVLIMFVHVADASNGDSKRDTGHHP